jgi:sec-independent protein translocase protein TatA
MTSGVFSPWHVAILVLAILLLFGPKRLPETGRSLGTGMREFKDSITGQHDEGDEAVGAVSAPPPERLGASGVADHDRV